MGRSGAGRHEGCEAGQGEARRGQAKRGRSLLSQLHSVCMAFLSQPVINKSLHAGCIRTGQEVDSRWDTGGAFISSSFRESEHDLRFLIVIFLPHA